MNSDASTSELPQRFDWFKRAGIIAALASSASIAVTPNSYASSTFEEHRERGDTAEFYDYGIYNQDFEYHQGRLSPDLLYESGEETSTPTVVQFIPTRPNSTGLFSVLHMLRSEGVDGDVGEALTPSVGAVSLAEIVLAFLIDKVETPKLGFGGDEDLYFSWENSEGVAFLTIDESELHLLVKPKSGQPIYRDDVPFDKKILSNEILPALRPYTLSTRARTSCAD